jgi:hypothetical protein
MSIHIQISTSLDGEIFINMGLTKLTSIIPDLYTECLLLISIVQNLDNIRKNNISKL